MDWKLSLAGLLVGVLVGMTGMGGGSLLTPILVILFGFDPTVAVGTDILHGAVFKSFGAVQHRRLGTVHARLTGWMFLGSGPMSLLGVALASWLEHRYGDGAQSTMSYAVGAALVVGGLGFLAKALLRDRVATSQMERLTNRDRAIAFAIGFVGGFIVGLTSVGSGTFFGLVMVLVYPLTIPKIVGTDIFHAAALLWVAGAGHLFAGCSAIGETTLSTRVPRIGLRSSLSRSVTANAAAEPPSSPTTSTAGRKRAKVRRV